jgi:lysine biosynthesis protein LysW
VQKPRESKMTNTTGTETSTIECLECGLAFAPRGQLEIGRFVGCPECGAGMEVVSLDPVEVDWIYDEPEYEDQGD